LNQAISHIWITHIKELSTGKANTGESGKPLTEKLKDWCCEVRVDNSGRILPETGSPSADTRGGSSSMNRDDDNEDAVMDSDILGSLGFTRAVDESSDIPQFICSNCSTQSSMSWGRSPLGKYYCVACRHIQTSIDMEYSASENIDPDAMENGGSRGRLRSGPADHSPFGEVSEAVERESEEMDSDDTYESDASFYTAVEGY
jgi:Zn ribbon nucleic-acid-binding protein